MSTELSASRPPLNEGNLQQIRYRSESTNLYALTGFAKLAACDRADLLAQLDHERAAFAARDKELCEAFETREQEMKEALVVLVKAIRPLDGEEKPDEARMIAAKAYLVLLRVAASLGIAL